VTKSRGIHAPRRQWTDEEDALLRAHYADTRAEDLAVRIGCTQSNVYRRAHVLGLKKPIAWIADRQREKMRDANHGGRRTQFPPGHRPQNAGLRRPGWFRGRMQASQFKKGERSASAAQRHKPVGTERSSKDGYLERKIHDGLPLQSRWRAVHLLLWEEANGPLPPGHALWFRNRDKRDIRLENLECITRAELARRNTAAYPPALRQINQLRGAITRQINRRRRREEQDR
jgi:hypothetical protein